MSRLNLKHAKGMRHRAGYFAPPAIVHPGYKFNGIHHMQEIPVYAKHERVIREMGPVISHDGGYPKVTCRVEHEYGETSRVRRRGTLRKIISRTVTKIRYGKDGKTPLSPEWHEVKREDGKIVMLPKTEVVPILKPLRLNKSAKALYRRFKRMWEQSGVSPCLTR